jgi:hypothetical protein
MCDAAARAVLCAGSGSADRAAGADGQWRAPSNCGDQAYQRHCPQPLCHALGPTKRFMFFSERRSHQRCRRTPRLQGQNYSARQCARQLCSLRSDGRSRRTGRIGDDFFDLRKDQISVGASCKAQGRVSLEGRGPHGIVGPAQRMVYGEWETPDEVTFRSAVSAQVGLRLEQTGTSAGLMPIRLLGRLARPER